jgi:outer membrane lipoprotein-sorting protein
MALIQPAQPEADEPGGEPGRRRRAARYAVPVAVAGIAAATMALVPALASAGSPSLPAMTAAQLLTKIAAANTQTVDGTVKITSDLGLPSALTGGSSLLGNVIPSGVPGLGSGSSAAPQTQLLQLLIGSHQLHVSADGPDKQKISITQSGSDYSVIHNGTQVWAYDSKTKQAYHQTQSKQSAAQDKAQQDKTAPQDIPATPQAAANQILKNANGTASITVNGTATVAGRSAYELVVTPQNASATTVGSIRIAVDSKTGVPLRFTLTPKGGGAAVFDIGFTKVSFAKPAASTFAFTPAKGVKVTESSKADSGTAQKDTANKDSAAANQQPTVLGKGWDTIAVIKTGSGLPSGGAGKSGAKSDKSFNGSSQSLLNSFGKKVSGSYGTGTLFHTRLANALLTDKGTLYIGAVTESALTNAANTNK